jgi:hypothetical protein
MLPRYPLVCVPGVVLAFVVPSIALADPINYRIDLGIEHNDNVTLSAHDPISEDILEPQIAFDLSKQGSSVQAVANGALQYRDYLGGEFSDEVRGQLSGRLNWIAIPQRLNVVVEDYLSVQPVNPLEQNTPNNQQQTNAFLVAPTLDFRVGETMRGEAGVRYINSYADETKEFNSQRAGAALKIIKDLDPSSSISANTDDEHVHFTDATGGPDYTRYSVFGRYTHKWDKINLTADLGYAWLRFTGGTFADRDAPLGRATLEWHPSDRSTFTGDFAYQFSDAASAMLATTDAQPATPTQPPPAVTVGDATTTSQAFLERRLGVAYRWIGERLTFNVNPYYRDLDYSDGAVLATGFNETGRGVTGGVSYLLRPLLTLGFAATGENLRYDSIGREDKTWIVGASLTQQWTRNWSGRLDLSRSIRHSNVADQSYGQNIIYFALVYTR